MLVKFIDDKKESWEDYLDTCIYAYNTARHESSKFTPFELMFSRRAVLPIDIQCDASDVLTKLEEGIPHGGIYIQYSLCNSKIYKCSGEIEIDPKKRKAILEQAKANIVIAQERQKKVYDRKHSNPEVFKIGAVVLKKDFTRKKRRGGKLDFKWVGPFTVVADLGRGLYRLQQVYDPTKLVSRVNGVHLKEYNMPSEVFIVFL